MSNITSNRTSDNFYYTSDLTFTWDGNSSYLNGVPLTRNTLSNYGVVIGSIETNRCIEFAQIGGLISKVIFNNPATVVFWKDGTKTVVKCSSKNEFDPYYGLCCAIAKKMIGNNSKIKKILKEATYCKEKKHD